jgi:hypothetical protein
MSDLQIDIDDGRSAFTPAADLSGKVSWSLEKPPRWLELRLFWVTRGKGTEDRAVVQVARFDQPQPAETRTFRFKLPEGPYSFSGKLISLVWALELVAEPSRAVSRVEIILAPEGREILLDSAPKAQKTGFTVTWR